MWLWDVWKLYVWCGVWFVGVGFGFGMGNFFCLIGCVRSFGILLVINDWYIDGLIGILLCL